MNKIKTYFKNLSTDEDDYQRLLHDIQEMLSNKDKSLIFLTGEGNSGKSYLTKLLSKYLDETYQIPENYLYKHCSKIQRQIDHEMEDIAKSKFLLFDNELQNIDKISFSKMKEITGNDEFYARKKYSKQPKIVASQVKKLIFVANKSMNPYFEGHGDPGMWRRIKLIPFKSTFYNDDPDDELIEDICQNHIDEFGKFINDPDEYYNTNEILENINDYHFEISI